MISDAETSDDHASGFSTWGKIGLAVLPVGLLATAYNLYDLKYPSHFVGDMYGYEVLFRLAVLAVTAGPMLIAAILLLVGRRMRNRAVGRVGGLVITIASIILVVLAVNIAHGRHLDDIRKGYPKKSIEELVRIAREEKDIAAIDAIMMKRDPGAVPALREILLDASELAQLRYAAAHALGNIGGDEAREALEKGLEESNNTYLTETIGHALDNLKRASLSKP